jgi:hypothetical protein
MTKPVILAFGLVLWLAGSAQAQTASASASTPTPKAEDFDWRQPLLVAGHEAVYRFDLPATVHRGARRRDLGDLRVFNGAGEVVPHALADDPPPVPRVVGSTPLAAFPLHSDGRAEAGAIEVAVRQRPDGTLVSTRMNPAKTKSAGLTGYLFDASTLPQPASALRLEWQPQPEGTVLPIEVAASDDLQSWHPVSAGTQLVDLRVGEQHLGQHRVELAGAGKYLRLSWPRDRQPIVLTTVQAETTAMPKGPDPLRWSTASGLRGGAQAGEFLFESDGLPVAALRLSLPETNTVVPLRVMHRDNDREPWREAIDTVAYRLSRQGQEIQSPPLPVGGGDRHWRLRFDQRAGGIGQGQPAVALGWLPRQAIFVARGAGPFSLAYGQGEVPPLGFQPATLIPGYRPEHLPQLPEARLGEPARIAPAAPAESPPAAVSWRSIGLWAVLIVGVLLLAGMVWRLLGQMGDG